jgi:hypothetical protein
MPTGKFGSCLEREIRVYEQAFILRLHKLSPLRLRVDAATCRTVPEGIWSQLVGKKVILAI